jgi:hypothetical protein
MLDASTQNIHEEGDETGSNEETKREICKRGRKQEKEFSGREKVRKSAISGQKLGRNEHFFATF